MEKFQGRVFNINIIIIFQGFFLGAFPRKFYDGSQKNHLDISYNVRNKCMTIT